MLRSAKAAGCRVLLMTDETQRHEAWPYDAIDEFIVTPTFLRYQDVINTVTWMARGQRIDLIIPLDEFEIELCAILREHMRLPGMGVSLMRHFRDKLTMRELTQRAGIPVPRFAHILNYDALRDYMGSVPPPWMLKPRMDAGSMGIRKLHDSEQVWRTLDALGDQQSYYLLEEFLPGAVLHVDSVVQDGQIIFASAQQYGAPPFDTYHSGGVFDTTMLNRDDPRYPALLDMNQRVIRALGLANGVAHAEFIQAQRDDQLYFLEVAARVGGAYISDMLDYATGVNPWREWFGLEMSQLEGQPYQLPVPRTDYGAVVLTLARDAAPDTSHYTDPEIVCRIDKPFHAGFVLVSPDHARLVGLVAQYKERMARDFTAVAPGKGVQRTGLAR
ncbi:MAG: ATP-grasp domain-containing protein [Anaerolineae bacterium]|nr:ATP-grasp domain-containing protein [Anaerolineae bacterium]MDW8173619.1 ATP-grasp domain-containing protein [Anaerolineae bacterium]